MLYSIRETEENNYRNLNHDTNRTFVALMKNNRTLKLNQQHYVQEAEFEETVWLLHTRFSRWICQINWSIITVYWPSDINFDDIHKKCDRILCSGWHCSENTIYSGRNIGFRRNVQIVIVHLILITENGVEINFSVNIDNNNVFISSYTIILQEKFYKSLGL